jgi:hypothetical protein
MISKDIERGTPGLPFVRLLKVQYEIFFIDMSLDSQ